MFWVGTHRVWEESSHSAPKLFVVQSKLVGFFSPAFSSFAAHRVEKLSFSRSFAFWARAHWNPILFVHITRASLYVCVRVCALVGLGYLHTWSHYSRVIGPKFQGKMKIGSRAHTAKIAHKSHQISPRGDDERRLLLFAHLLSWWCI